MPASTKLPEGLWPVMLTPFQNNNALDLEGLRRLTDMYLEAGANGLFANCLSSEMYQLTEEERLSITRTVIRQSNGRAPVAATGTFSTDTDRNVEFIRKIHDSGASVVILITSILANPQEGDDILKRRIEEIMQKTDGIPLGLYECPVPYKRLVSPEMMQWLAGTGRFLYHKDTSCHPEAIEKKVRAISGGIFNLYNADTPTALDSLDSGASGISPISANFYPEVFSYLFRQYRAQGRTPELTQLHSLLVVMDRLVHTFYPYSAKVFLQKRGLKITAASRIPAEVMPRADSIRFDALYDVFQSLIRTYDIKPVEF
jgi:4-hydroxy-tetrahydrodipicolinate synthase